MFYVEPHGNAHILRGHASAEDPLEGSVEKWQFIVDWLSDNPDEVLLNGSAVTCSLCYEYGIFSDHDDRWSCAGCPIAEHTGHAGCRHTPYDLYCDDPSLANAEAELCFLRRLQ